MLKSKHTAHHKASGSRAEFEPAPLPPEDERDPKDPYATLLSEDECTVAFISDQRQENFGKESYKILMKITEGPACGSRILLPVPCIPDKKPPRPGFKYCALWVACTQRRLPKDLWRRRPRDFMKGCVFRASVSTVTKNSRGETRPIQLHYSRIDQILERVAGSPPCLSEISR